MDRTRLVPSVAAVFAVVVIVVGCSAGPLVTPTPPPATTTATPAATADPSPSTTASTSAAPPLSERFTSTLHGFSMSYPEGWTTQAATEPWTGGGPALFREPPADFLYDPALTDHLFLSLASKPLGDSAPDEWVAEHLYECATGEPIAMDGASGLIGAADCNWAAVTTDGRGYMIWLHTSGDEAWLETVYDRAWFEEVLATVQLHPEDAVDAAPPATP
jgi:hypothetical protein